MQFIGGVSLKCSFIVGDGASMGKVRDSREILGLQLNGHCTRIVLFGRTWFRGGLLIRIVLMALPSLV